MGYAKTRERSWIGDLLTADTEDLQTIPLSEIHVKKFKAKEVDIQTKRKMNLYSHTERAKYCKKDSRYPQLGTKREATSSNNFNTNLQKKMMKPEIEVQILKIDKISGELWEITNIGIVFAPRTTLSVSKDDFPRPLNYIDVQRLTKNERRPSMIIGK